MMETIGSSCILARKMEWTKEKTIQLINEIHGKPVIWDISLKDYKKKNKKIECLRELAHIFECTQEDIEKKITSLRSQYSRELQKVQKSRKSGSGADDIYHSKWFGFPLMGFMRCGNVPNAVRTNISEEKQLHSDDTASIVSVESDDATLTVETQIQHTTSDTDPDNSPNKRSSLKRRNRDDDFMDAVIPRMQVIKDSHENKTLPSRDENDVFGELVAAEMRKIKDPYVHARTKLNIHQLLFEAQFSNPFTPSTPVNSPPPFIALGAKMYQET